MWFFGSKKKKEPEEKDIGKEEKEIKPDAVEHLTRKIEYLEKEIKKLRTGADGVGRSLSKLRKKPDAVKKSELEKVIEGVFDGQMMVGADGERYDVPANYASKSKLVEGDVLKLTINNLGAFVYKQIRPVERVRMVGRLEQDSQNLQYYAVTDGKKWRLLTASVTYFKGEPGDVVYFVIPAEGGSRWAAVESIIKKNDEEANGEIRL